MERDRAHERLVMVAEAANGLQAQFLVDLLLQQGGIKALARNAHGSLPGVYGGDGPYSILVLEGDVQAAAFIVADDAPLPNAELPGPALPPARRYRKHPPRG